MVLTSYEFLPVLRGHLLGLPVTVSLQSPRSVVVIAGCEHLEVGWLTLVWFVHVHRTVYGKNKQNVISIHKSVNTESD